MRIVFDSQTGNVKRFCSKLKYKTENIAQIKEKINEKYIIITYTTNFGEVPKTTKKFINDNEQIVCVISSGNKNWGDNFAKAEKIIKNKFKLKWSGNFEMSGTNNDVKKIQKIISDVQKQVGEKIELRKI